MSSIFQNDKKYPKSNDPNSYLVKEKEKARDIEVERLESRAMNQELRGK